MGYLHALQSIERERRLAFIMDASCAQHGGDGAKDHIKMLKG